ncbi:MAG: hypothetical protein ACLUEV_07180 [Alistipes sp.]
MPALGRKVRRNRTVAICSTDGTIAIAEKYGCRIVYHERTGIVEPARNYAIAQAETSGCSCSIRTKWFRRAAGIPVPVRRNGRQRLRCAENGA